MNNCSICNNKLKRLDNQKEIVKYKTSNGLKDILLEGLTYSQCVSCGEVFYSADDIELHDSQLEKVLEHERSEKGLLTAKEIKQIRKKLKLTQSGLEKLLNISPKNVAKWETYRSDQSKPVDKILRVISQDKHCFIALSNDDTEISERKQDYIKNNENDIIVEYIKKFYPDLSEEMITTELITKMDQIMKDTINKYFGTDSIGEITHRKAI